MAKSINVPLDINALTDARFGHLAKLLGLADGDHARGKMEWLWADCTLRGETELPQWLVEQRLGELGPDALIEAELATWAGGRGDSKTRRMYIAGSKERLLWYRGKDEQRAKGGKTRASRASRNPAGQFQQAGSEAGGSEPAEARSLDLDLSLDPESSLPRAHAIPPTPAPVPVPSTEPEPARPEPRSPAPTAHDRSRSAPDPRIKINHDAWAHAAREHAKLRGAGIDPTAIPWPAMPSGGAKDDLVARTRDLVGDPPNYQHAIAVHRRRVEVAVAEAKRERHLRWFLPSVFYERERFERAADTSPQQAAASRHGPRSQAVEPRRVLAHEDDAPHPSIAHLVGKAGT